MPSVSLEQKRAVKAANDIADIVGGYIPVLPAGKNFKALCPFHDDHRPSLQIDRQFQNYRCWACGAHGDVFDFVMKFDKVEFPEALRLLAARAGINLDPAAEDPLARVRARLLDAVEWAELQYRTCLLDEPEGETARAYLGTRRLSGSTVRQFGLGFAPVPGDWLVRRAAADGVPPDVLLEVGLIAERGENRGYYDRFRDRVMFPIRDARGRPVGFGGRILPGSALAARGPKYYNSSDTPLFSKSDLLYGLDLARHPGAAVGYLAVVEGYTDVMAAHQDGVANVVATMGTALNARHVSQLRRYAPKVVLVFDADDGGNTGVDRALELFVSQDVELAVATLPDGLDPADLLGRPGGVQQFRDALAGAVDALEFKLSQLLARSPGGTVDGTQRVVDSILGVMALAPPRQSQSGQVRQELIVTRLAHRLGLRQETVWARLNELKAEQRKKVPTPPARTVPRAGPVPMDTPEPVGRGHPAPAKADGSYLLEVTLLRLLIAEPGLVPQASDTVRVEDIKHTGIQRLIGEMYELWAAGQVPDLDAMRVRLLDRADLVKSLMDQLDIGRALPERPEKLRTLLADFRRTKTEVDTRAVAQKIKAGPASEHEARELLRRLQAQPHQN